jgi:hypothetical protein
MQAIFFIKSHFTYTAKEILKWPGIFDDYNFWMNLFSIYIFFEIGGNGGGCFRCMYSRFLNEAAGITGNRKMNSWSWRERRVSIPPIWMNFKLTRTAKERLSIGRNIYICRSGALPLPPSGFINAPAAKNDQPVSFCLTLPCEMCYYPKNTCSH